jgi:hypothetical protein
MFCECTVIHNVLYVINRFIGTYRHNQLISCFFKFPFKQGNKFKGLKKF